MAIRIIKGIPDLVKESEKFKKRITIKVANLAKNHFLDGFRKGGRQTDQSRGGWKPRKKSDPKKRGRRAVLVSRGTLRNDIDTRKTTFEEIVIGTSEVTEDYAHVHNEGGRSGRGKGFDMPQREFLGKSRKLDAKIKRKVLQELKKVYK
jgi:phage gpG-like protein